MREIRNIMAVAMLCLTSLFCTGQLKAQANVQFIHNSPDPLLDSVDVYVYTTFAGATLVLDNFKFRDATDFLNMPSVPAKLIITPGNGTGIKDSVATIDATLPPATYVLYLEGVTNPTEFAPNPEGKNIKLHLDYITPGRHTAATSGNFDFFIYHGAPDRDKLDIRVRDAEGMDISTRSYTYGDHSDYISVAGGKKYYIDLLENGTQKYISTLGLDLGNTELYDPSQSRTVGVVMLSGFANPAANKNGKTIGAYLVRGTAIASAFKNSPAIKLADVKEATVQFIHNSADQDMGVIDLYANNNRIAKNIGFRTATGMVQVPADNNETIISIALGNSSSIQDSILTLHLPMLPGATYMMISRGMLFPAGFKANPDGRDLNAGIDVYEYPQVASKTTGQFDLAAYHGISDMASLYVVSEQKGAQFLSNKMYTEWQGYAATEEATTLFAIQNSDKKTLYKFEAELKDVADSAGIIMLSGFDDFAANKNGATVGIYIVLPSGRIISTTEKDTGTIGIAEAGAESIAIFPNPANEVVNLSLHLDRPALVTYTIADISGKVISAETVGQVQQGDSNLPIAVSKLATGVYTIRLQAGNTQYFCRLMKQ